MRLLVAVGTSVATAFASVPAAHTLQADLQARSSGSFTAPTSAADARTNEQASLSIAHGIAALPNRVDIYADQTKLASAMAAGDIETVSLKPRTYDIVVVPVGAPRFTSNPVMRVDDVTLRPGDNRTIALHLSQRNRPTSTVFSNQTRTVGQNMGRLTFRHIAQAPGVDVRSRGSVMLDNVRNSQSADRGLRSGDYLVRIVREGTRDKLVPTSEQTITNKPGRQDMGNNRIVYLWGSLSGGSLDLMVHDIPLDLR